MDRLPLSAQDIDLHFVFPIVWIIIAPYINVHLISIWIRVVYACVCVGVFQFLYSLF